MIRPKTCLSNKHDGVLYTSCECIAPCGVFRCTSCGLVFNDTPNPGFNYRVSCHRCNEKYVEWTNFEEWRRAHNDARKHKNDVNN